MPGMEQGRKVGSGRGLFVCFSSFLVYFCFLLLQAFSFLLLRPAVVLFPGTARIVSKGANERVVSDQQLTWEANGTEKKKKKKERFF